ncbi:M20/M25/M40 family metallo-hydrolase [Ruminococcaceae bacterium OttesenSCG-928-N02]|nr:M20/M25/M40 family metallo-hydrolase [Ruminococcaceae bacterium OttesenSCG-928-N02]
MANMKLLGELANAFGPSGFEDDVVKVIKENMGEFELERDHMLNLYARRPGEDSSLPTVMLDSHTDEVGFMVQAVMDNGLCRLKAIGGWVDSNIPAHMVLVRNKWGELVPAITSSKPPHFMTPEERAKNISLSDIYLDFGVTSKKELEEVFGIEAGCPVAPDVTSVYNEKTGVLMGKTFDNRAGNLCAIETMKALKDEKLGVAPLAAFASQEEIGVRGAKITAQKIKPDLAIVFEGTPSDDFFVPASEAQGALKKGAQIRYIDGGMLSNPAFIRYARKLAEEKGIPVQFAVRAGGSTNGASIHLANEGVPTLVLGVPTRYAHTHYCYVAQSDLDACINLAVEIIKTLNAEKIREIFYED